MTTFNPYTDLEYCVLHNFRAQSTDIAGKMARMFPPMEYLGDPRNPHQTLHQKASRKLHLQKSHSRNRGPRLKLYDPRRH